MNLNGLGEEVLSFVNSDPFIFWLFSSILGLVTWWAGCADKRKQYPLSIAKWLAVFICQHRRSHRLVFLRSFVMQILGILMLASSLSLAILVSDHDQRINLFGGIVFGLMVVAMLFILVRERQ